MKLSKLLPFLFFILTLGSLLENISNVSIFPQSASSLLLSYSRTYSSEFTSWPETSRTWHQNSHDKRDNQVVVSLGTLQSPGMDSEQGGWDSHNVPQRLAGLRRQGIQLVGRAGKSVISTCIQMKLPTFMTTNDWISICQGEKLSLYPEGLKYGCRCECAWECVICKERNCWLVNCFPFQNYCLLNFSAFSEKIIILALEDFRLIKLTPSNPNLFPKGEGIHDFVLPFACFVDFFLANELDFLNLHFNTWECDNNRYFKAQNLKLKNVKILRLK